MDLDSMESMESDLNEDDSMDSDAPQAEQHEESVDQEDVSQSNDGFENADDEHITHEEEVETQEGHDENTMEEENAQDDSEANEQDDSGANEQADSEANEQDDSRGHEQDDSGGHEQSVDDSVRLNGEQKQVEDLAEESQPAEIETQEEESNEKKNIDSLQANLDGDTEMVSEDEFDEGANKAPLETEEVSDTELPASITEALETEAVSDEELPPVKRKKKSRRDSSHDSEASAPKKGKIDRDRSRSPSDSRDGDEKSSSKPAHPAVKSKVLHELEKYWKAVNDDPTDFTGWTYLLQYVDQESDVDAAREAYDAFLALYPYCYGYWRKYADYEKRKGDKDKSEEVFLRGLKAIPLSVDLWLTYLNFVKSQYKDNEEHIRSEYQRAIEICGLEFRSDRLWESFIKWEMEGKHYHNAFKLYEKLLITPTQNYKGHFEDFEDFVRCQQPNKILSTDEFLSLRSEVLQKLRNKPGKDAGLPSAAPPGDDEDDQPSPAHADEETTLIRERIISSRKKLYKETVAAVQARWNYEEGIKRPYFHVKSLEKSQLNTWRDYLDYEIAQGNEERTIILFERCLIACALYQEFWIKFIKYLEDLPKDTSEKIRNVYERACLIHHPKKPFLALSWATFEEELGNYEAARTILNRLEDNVPNLLHVMVRRINLERRAGDFEAASQLYEKYIATCKSKSNFIVLSIKYARFAWKILKDINKGVQVLRKALEKDPDNPRLYSQLLELTLMNEPFSENACLDIFNEAVNNEAMELEFRRIFAQRKVEFLEDFGSSIKSVREANAELTNIMKELRDKKKSSASKYDVDKARQDDIMKSSASKSKDTGGSSSYQSNSVSYNSTNYSGPPSSYDSSSTNMGGQYGAPPSGQYGPPPSYSAPPVGPDASYQAGQQSGYQSWGYSQSSGYGNYGQGWPNYNYYS